MKARRPAGALAFLILAMATSAGVGSPAEYIGDRLWDFFHNSNAPVQFTIRAFRPDGTFDTSFNETGRAIFAGNFEATVQSDGKVVCKTYRAASPERQISVRLYRMRADGSPDRTFGDKGIASIEGIINVTPNGYLPNKMAAAPHGQILLTGIKVISGTFIPTVVRLLSNGRLDPTFGHGGVSLLSTVVPFESPQALLSLPDGKTLLAVRGKSMVTLARLNVDGSIDLGFGKNGTTAFPAANSSYPIFFLASVSGKSIVAYSEIATQAGKYGEVAKVIRLNSDGSLDTAYGSANNAVPGAWIQSGFGGHFGFTADPKGRVVLWYPNYGSNQMLLSRLTVDGKIDPSFGASGTIISTLGFSMPKIQASYDVAIKGDDGKIALLATVLDDHPFFGVRRVRVYERYDENGNLDVDFGKLGRVVEIYPRAASVFSALSN